MFFSLGLSLTVGFGLLICVALMFLCLVCVFSVESMRLCRVLVYALCGCFCAGFVMLCCVNDFVLFLCFCVALMFFVGFIINCSDWDCRLAVAEQLLCSRDPEKYAGGGLCPQQV